MRKSMWAALAASILAVCAPNANADTIRTFDISGTAMNVSGGALSSCAADDTCAFSGTLKVDITNGTVMSLGTIDLTLPGLPTFDFVGLSQSLPPTDWMIGAIDLSANNGEALTLAFTTTNPASLVGFDGGTIFSGNSFVINNLVGGFTYDNINGSIVPAPTTTPESNSLALMLIGLAVLGWIALTRVSCNGRPIA